MDQSQERLWKIGQIAGRAGVSADTVRHYERRGLVCASWIPNARSGRTARRKLIASAVLSQDA